LCGRTARSDAAMCFFCPDTPPDKVQALGKGGLGTRGQANEHMLGHANDPHQFAIGMKHVCQAEPGCCILSGIGAPCGFTACWARKAVLEKYEQNGLDDFVCFQRYIPKCCCIDFTNQCPGGTCGLILEGCCCPIFSLSIARIHMMDRKNLRPDPCDYQLIHCSNALQCLSCIVSIVAIFVEELEEIAQIIDLIADLFTCSVAGCMGAQVHHEIKNDANGIVYVDVVEGVPINDTPGSPPVVTAYATRVDGAPLSDEMAR